jgi:hypothetical protein
MREVLGCYCGGSFCVGSGGDGGVSNVVVVGLAVDATLAVTPQPEHLAIRAGLLVTGIVLNYAETPYSSVRYARL